MKKIIFYFLFVIGSVLKAQTNADCINAIPLCTTPNFTFYSTAGNGNVNELPGTNSVSNPATNPNPPNSGCLLAGENVPQWLLITIGNSGNLEFVFGAGNSSNPQVGYYDWAMWPYNANTCSGIINNTLPPVRCNWNASSSGGTGIASAANIPPGGNPGNYQPPLAVSACQQYIICISNYSGVNTLVSFQSLGTASLSCNPNCNPNYVMCAGSSATIVPVNFNGLTNATYSLQPGGTSNTTGSFVVSPSSTTQYTTYITGTNSNNAIQTTTALSTVTVNTLPVLAPTFTQATCSNTTNAVNLGLTFNPSSPTSYTVNWNPQPSSVTNNTQTTATNLNGGITNVTVTAAGGCSAAVSFTMNSAAAPTLTLTNLSGSNSITCTTPTINMLASSNYTSGSLNYYWSSTSFSANTQSVGIAQSGTYNVCVTDPATSCSACQSFTLYQNMTVPTNTVAPISQVITCGNSGTATFTSTVLSPSVNFVTNWYSPQTTFPGPPSQSCNTPTCPYAAAGLPGTYTVEVCDLVNGCCNTKTVSVTSNAGFPTFQTSSTTNYSVGCSPLNQTTLCIVNAQSASMTAVQFAWLAPGTNSTIPLPPTSFSGTQCTVTGVAGTWTAVVNDPTNNCQTALPVQVLSNTLAPNVAASYAPASQTLTCTNPTILATGTSSTANTIVTWQQPNAPGTVSSNTIILGPGSGPATSTTSLTYANYTVVATNSVNACKSTSVVVVNQNFKAPIPLISVGNPSVINCNNQPVVMSFTNVAVISGTANGGIAQVVQWAGPAPSPTLGGVSTYSGYVAGIYTLTVRDSYNGCLGVATTTNIPDLTQPPVIAIPSNTTFSGCGNDAVLNVSLLQPLSAWSLYFNGHPAAAAFTPSTAIQPANSPTFTGASANVTVNLVGPYKYVVTNLITGCRSFGTYTVTGGSIAADFTADPVSGYAPLTVGFNNTSATSTGATSSITSIWAFGNGTSSLTASPVTSAIYTSPGTYTVMLISTRGGCIDTAYKVIKVDIPSKLEIPNVFTPNGDGSNDQFFLHATNLSEITASIFDRWGNKVYEVTSNTGNILWDGKNQAGKECAPGTYFYIIKATGKDNQSFEQKGNVSLYR